MFGIVKNFYPYIPFSSYLISFYTDIDAELNECTRTLFFDGDGVFKAAA